MVWQITRWRQVHWDHIGEPREFSKSTFIVGYGAFALLDGTALPLRGGHSFFESNLLPQGRTIELSEPSADTQNRDCPSSLPDDISFRGSWRTHGNLPHVLDPFNDGSLLIVNAPGHLPGHINLLARISESHQVYLGGDACHDRRLLTGEKTIGEWSDSSGRICCIHADRKQAEETIERIKTLEKNGVEVVFAHDIEWANNPANKVRFFGADQGVSFSEHCQG